MSVDDRILLWGPVSDAPLGAVAASLVRRRVPFFLVDPARALDTEIAFSCTGEAELQGELSVAGSRCDLARVRAAYLRPDGQRAVPPEPGSPAARAYDHGLQVDEALCVWAELTPALVINRMSAMASNGSKPYQASLIQAAGFTIPDTLVTTDIEALRHFRAQHERVIFKSVSAVRSVVTELSSAHEARFTNLAHCPTQFQAYIPGRDVRVHVIGSEVFAHEIDTSAVDYRYASFAGQSVEIRGTKLPTDIAERCFALTEALGLVFAGIDLRLTPGGEWFCFEANPSPAFTFYDREEGAPIAEAVAGVLAGAAR